MVTTRAATTVGMRFPFSGQPPILAAGFESEPATVGAARVVVRDALTSRQVSEDTIQDMLLLVSELVTNAITHAQGPYQLRLYAGTGLLGFEVQDANPGPLAFPMTPAEGELTGEQTLPECGRGLTLVAALTLGRCGWHPSEDQPGKSVWLLLDLR